MHRDVFEGLTASVAALLAMACTAAAGLVLLDADRIGGLDSLTAAVVALAVGGSAELGAAPAGGLPVAMRGAVDVLPLGVSLVGAVVLGTLLARRGGDGLLVRGAVAVAAFPAGLAAVAWLARGTMTLHVPEGGLGASGCSDGASACSENGGLGASACADVGGVGCPGGGGEGCSERGGFLAGSFGGGESLDAGFSVAVGPALAGAAVLALVVVAVCWLAVRFRAAAGLRALRWPVVAVIAGCLLAAWVFGGAAAAGGVLLVLPLAVFGVLLLGLGVPWTVRSEGALSCALDAAAPLSPDGPLMWASGAALLGCGIVTATRTATRPGGPLRRATVLAVRLAAMVGAVLAVVTLLSRASIRLGVDVLGFSLPVLDAQLAANPLLALGTGLAGGAVAGFAGSLLVDGYRSRSSVSWPAWTRQLRR